jgi:membrane-bound serine protease (ClpP class)
LTKLNIRRAWAIGLGFLTLLLSTSVYGAGVVKLATIDGSINPASADFLIRAIEQSEEDSAAALLIELDTPGGLVSSTKDIIQAMLNSEVPIIVYVAPRGAWASSAGTFITVAANIAAMAPGTSIGAAHPVGVGGGSPAGGKEKDGESGEARDYSLEKAENLLAAYMETIARKRNRNVDWVVDAVRDSVAIGETEALELGVIDLIAENKRELLEAVQGRMVELNDGSEIALDVANAKIEPLDMSTLQKLFNFLADPNVAMVLFLAGLIGIYIEVNNPGLIVPGVAGVACLILTAIAFQILPFSWVGLILVLCGVGLLAAELFVPSLGLLFAAGLGCVLLGGTMLFDRPDLSSLTVSFWQVLVPAVAGVGIFGGGVVFAGARSQSREQQSGVSELIGLRARAVTSLTPGGKVLVRGEYWNVESDEPVADGAWVEVVAVEGMQLRVRPVVEEN